ARAIRAGFGLDHEILIDLQAEVETLPEGFGSRIHPHGELAIRDHVASVSGPTTAGEKKLSKAILGIDAVEGKLIGNLLVGLGQTSPSGNRGNEDISGVQ